MIETILNSSRAMFVRSMLLVALVLPVFGESSLFSRNVENFALIDHQGKFHEFDYYSRDPHIKGVVLFIQGNGCPLVRKRVPDFKRLRDAYQPRGIHFAMLNANPQDNPDDLGEEAREFGIDVPILKDSAQLVTRMLGIERTAEAFLIDTESRQVMYRGPIDDRLTYQKEKPEASRSYLKDAIEAMLDQRPIASPKVEAPGCRIALKSSESSANAYSKVVAPILKSRCVECHTKGGVGPFSMSSYKKVRGWSEMIAEVIITKQMPPWHADPHIGDIADDQSLKDEEARSIVEWIRAGSPRGEGPDPLEAYEPEVPEWKIGTPDYIVELPKQDIPAEGLIDYRYVYVDSPFEKGVWVRAAEVNPGNTRVVHHVVATSEHPSAERKRKVSGQWITGYAPGANPTPYPEGTGVFLPKGHRLKFEMHYTASGRKEQDQTRLGLYLHEAAPPKKIKTGLVVHRKFEIPPHAREHSEFHAKKIDEDITIFGINPHMHFRGKWMNFTLRKPDGSEQPLLSVPNYHFNWQRRYLFKEPVRVPAGSSLLVRNAWDNSGLNPHNPDPSKAVGWGRQSFDEMFFASFTYVLTD